MSVPPLALRCSYVCLWRDALFRAGERFTEADLRLCMTLFRFDEVYVVYFKCNKRFLSSYPNIDNYIRDVYQFQGLGKSINLEHCKIHYFSSHPNLNHYAIVPVGPGVDFSKPHDRHIKFPAKEVSAKAKKVKA